MFCRPHFCLLFPSELSSYVYQLLLLPGKRSRLRLCSRLLLLSLARRKSKLWPQSRLLALSRA